MQQTMAGIEKRLIGKRLARTSAQFVGMRIEQ